MSTELTLNGVTLASVSPEAIVSDVVRGFLGGIRDVVEDVPGRAGALVFDEEPGDRTITVVLTLGADDPAGRRSALERVADWVDLETAAPLIIGDEPDRYWLVKLAGMSDPQETVLTGVVELVFRASAYAFALELSDLSLELVANVEETFDIADTIKAFPIIEVEADEALDNGFLLRVNGLELVYGSAMAPGDVVTVSSVSFTVSAGANTDGALAGVWDTDALAMSDVDGDFPVLVPGTNTITIEGGDATVTITWRRRYRA